MSLIYPATPEPSLNLELEEEWKTFITSFESGAEQRRQAWAFPKRHLRLPYNALTPSEMAVLWNFYKSTKGQKDWFYWFHFLSEDHDSEYVGRGDGSQVCFDLPGKELVDASLALYVNGVEPPDVGWLENGGFETGDFSGWTQYGSVLDDTQQKSGTWSCKLVCTGSDPATGAVSDAVRVNVFKKYQVNSWNHVEGYTAGTARLTVQFYSDEAGTAFVSYAVIFSKTAATSGWEGATKTVGPASLFPDIEFPADTKSIRLQQEGVSAPDLTYRIDDISLAVVGDSRGYVMLPGGAEGDGDKVCLQPGNTPVAGDVISADIEGKLRLKMRFADPRMSKKMFSAQLYTTGLKLVESKDGG